VFHFCSTYRYVDSGWCISHLKELSSYRSKSMGDQDDWAVCIVPLRFTNGRELCMFSSPCHRCADLGSVWPLKNGFCQICTRCICCSVIDRSDEWLQTEVICWQMSMIIAVEFSESRGTVLIALAAAIGLVSLII
jgi:hypothetical protein